MLIREILDIARQRGDEPFLHFGDQSWTCAEFVGLCEAAALAWTAAGVRKGDLAALALTNSPQYVAALFGLSWIGGVAVPVNTAYQPEEALYVIGGSGARYVLSEPALQESTLEPVRDRLTDVRRFLSVVDPADGFTGRTAPEHSAPRPDLDDEDLGAILYTSGTTGHPKGAMAPQGMTALNGLALGRAIDLRPGDVHYSLFPLFHVNAQTIVSAALQLAAQVVLAERFSLNAFWPTVHEHGVTHVSYLGSVIPLLDKREDPLEKDTTLRLMWGAGLTAEAKRRLEARWGVLFIEVYGSTEVGVATALPYDGERRDGSCGVAIGEHDIRIIDENGAEVPRGTPGQIVVKLRPGMFQGYLNAPEATALAIRDGWMHTGDIAKIDEDGYLFFLDRSKDIIRRGGENISSADIEVAILAHPAVLDAAAVPAPDDIRDEEVRVVVVLKEGAVVQPAELVEWCAGRLAPYKVPRYVEVVPDLPRTATGKIRKAEIRSMFRQRAYFDRLDEAWHEPEVEATTAEPGSLTTG